MTALYTQKWKENMLKIYRGSECVPGHQVDFEHASSYMTLLQYGVYFSKCVCLWEAEVERAKHWEK